MIPAAANQAPTADSFHAATPDLHQIPQGNHGLVGQAQPQQLPGQGLAQPANAAFTGGMPAPPQSQHVPAGNALPSDHMSTHTLGQPQFPIQTPQQVSNQLPGPSQNLTQMPSADQYAPQPGQHAGQVMQTPHQIPNQLPGPGQIPSADPQYAPHSGQHAGQVVPADARGHSLVEPGNASAQAPSSRAALSFEDAAQTMLTDIAKVVVFDQQGTVLFSSFQTAPTELSRLPRLFGNRDTAISSGMVVGSKRYEVHKFHPPLMYGRAQQGVEPDAAEGAALYAVERNSLGRPAYAFATYKLPVVSAKAVPQLVQFVRQTMQT